MELLHIALTSGLRVHPRVAQQQLATAEMRDLLARGVPDLAPFPGRHAEQIVALLDWDHRLPSKKLALRLHLLYDAAGVTRFEAAFTERLAAIARRDLFPEFDVPDFEDLPGDESYDVDLDGQYAVEGVRLVSPWRRQIDPRLGTRAVKAARGSKEFARVRAAGGQSRAPHLGDLEAVSWMPPCESGHERWTIDVWWLTAFDGRIGTGWSFLVDPDDDKRPVVTHREFSVRAS